MAKETQGLTLNAAFYSGCVFVFLAPNQLEAAGLAASYYYLFLSASYILSSCNVFSIGLN